MKLLWTACIGIALFIVPATAHAGNVPEPAGYRMDNYRAAVPSSLQGAGVILTDEAEHLWKQKEALFLDVMPRLPRPKDLPEGTIWRDKPRHNIPGSVWLANVGYGALTTEMETYFRGGLEAKTGGDLSRKIVFYCMTDCWMSWNAAKRALSWGYANVLWYPAGADGWEAGGLPLAEAKPY
ncbi:MAG: PQQ-dependent catabolism-associated CXXCW motif protein [Aestuariivirga sp.]